MGEGGTGIPRCASAADVRRVPAGCSFAAQRAVDRCCVQVAAAILARLTAMAVSTTGVGAGAAISAVTAEAKSRREARSLASRRCPAGVSRQTGRCRWFNLLLGLTVRDPESAGLAGIVPVVILVFTSSVLVPIATMPGWLQAFAKANPVTVSTDAFCDSSHPLPPLDQHLTTPGQCLWRR